MLTKYISGIMFYNHHFIGMHWIWWVIITVLALLIFFDVIPNRLNYGSQEDPLDILKERIAHGEIEKEEFEERKKILKKEK